MVVKNHDIVKYATLKSTDFFWNILLPVFITVFIYFSVAIYYIVLRKTIIHVDNLQQNLRIKYLCRPTLAMML